MSGSRRESMLMLRARIAVERAEMVLALGDLRQAATPGGFAGGLVRGLWAGARGWVGGGADGGPGATALLRMLRRGSRLAPLLAAAWPVLRVVFARRRAVRRMLLGAALVAAAWGAWSATVRRD
ncbi:MAG: hypothetical protein KGN16_02600 [Burkholderiales bacterium]|nr:hypothetical protein [Burkholderiales bacterium]